jgi:chromosome partitioning protein
MYFQTPGTAHADHARQIALQVLAELRGLIGISVLDNQPPERCLAGLIKQLGLASLIGQSELRDLAALLYRGAGCCDSLRAMVEARTREPWVIALASQKGGVGKTTLALELAAVFADTSGRALVVDIDPQRTAEEIITASSDVAFDFAAEDDPTVLKQLRTVRDYDAIIVDCPGSLEGRETLAGVLAAASYAVIPMVPERAAVQPTLRTARLCADHGVAHRVVVNMADPLSGAGPVEAAWELLDELKIPRMSSLIRRYVAHSQSQLDGRMITDYRGDRSWSNALADVRRVQGEMLLELGRL